MFKESLPLLSLEHRLKDGRSLTIREARVEDAEAILDVVKEVASEESLILLDKGEYDVRLEKRHIVSAKASGKTLILVAEVDGKVVGVGELKVGEFKKNSHTAELGLAVTKEFRGLGVGKALMEEMLSRAEKMGVEKVCLSVFSTNNAAITLYEKFGFVVEGVRKKQFKIGDTYIDELLMAKFLR
jgi:ribosomal protein S18 acetylase RimI-like enzyme